jgi:hypothetical protein
MRSSDKTMLHAAKWVTLSNFANQGLVGAVTFLLAALLNPAQFGTVAMAYLSSASYRVWLQLRPGSTEGAAPASSGFRVLVERWQRRVFRGHCHLARRVVVPFEPHARPGSNDQCFVGHHDH